MSSDAASLTEPTSEGLAPGGSVQVQREQRTAPPGDRALAQLEGRQLAVLVLAVFAAGLCSIVYELLVGTASSYFLGDSVRQFSITIGLFMASMGLGSYLSRHLGEQVLRSFVWVEIALGVVGGLCIPALYATYAYTDDLYQPVMLSFIVVIGTLTGLEIPILVLAMRRFFRLKENLSNILSLDYFGALAATLLFPFVLLPTLGTFKSSLAIGGLNIVVALIVLRSFKAQLEPSGRSTAWLVASLALLGQLVLMLFSAQLLRGWHGAIYEDRVLLMRQSKYQKLVLTEHKTDLRLFLNGNLQFSSLDEHRYHEALVQPAFALAARGEHVLVLGGGDGLAVRELLKHPTVQRITLVDLDPAVTELAMNHHRLRQLNQGSLSSSKVTIRNEDAWAFMEHTEERFDLILMDLPDPNDVSVARLYSREFFGLTSRHLARDGVFVTQSTSPFFAPEAFWTIERSVAATGLQTLPYHANVPSFGDWGFVMAAHFPLDPKRIHIDVHTRYLDDALVPSLFRFPKDVLRPGMTPSTLDEPRVLQAYLRGWKQWE
ncbi:MAG: polyamine aminopropyltransferase [Myxococcales bacterium]|nr:polyamine aminopropyltransferase [Myxococcales bacterium]